MYELLEKLCSIGGVSGREDKVREFIISEIDGFADWRVDPLGNLIVHKKGKSPAKNKVMFDAHMDEVGMIVTYITDEGMLKFSAVGGVDPRVYLGRSVNVGDKEISGVVGLKPIHMLSKEEELDMPKADEIYIDIGAESADEAREYVSLGDTVVFDSGIRKFGDGFVQGRALDDRMGCAVMIEMIKSELEYDADFSFSVQEEIARAARKLRRSASDPIMPSCSKPRLPRIFPALTAKSVFALSARVQSSALWTGALSMTTTSMSLRSKRQRKTA